MKQRRQSDEWRRPAFWFGHTILTVLSSVGISIWAQDYWAGQKTSGNVFQEMTREQSPIGSEIVANVGNASEMHFSVVESEEKTSLNPNAPTKAFEVLILALRSSPQLQLFRIELPGRWLKFQRSLAQEAVINLQAKSEKIPFIAVPRRATELIEAMGVVYIDPKGTPRTWWRDLSLRSAPKNLATAYILVPDISQQNRRHFRW